MRSCGMHGRCTPGGTKTEAYRPPPTSVDVPSIAFPAANSTVSGGVTIAWIDAPNIERWSIRLEKDTGGAQMQTASDEENPGQLDEWKRETLLLAGADAVIADYREASNLVAKLVAG